MEQQAAIAQVAHAELQKRHERSHAVIGYAKGTES
jgi:hypothetical protein